MESRQGKSRRQSQGQSRVTAAGAALRRMEAAGLRGLVVERCPAPGCEVCSRRLRPAA